MNASPALVLSLALLLAYLLGSISFAVVTSRLFGLADPRSYGSGNPGATNVLRSGNKKAAIVTLLGDALKGAVAVLLAQHYQVAFGFSDTDIALVGLAAFVGHLFPVFLKFRGGKGVATAAGVLLALNGWLGLAVLGTWIAVAMLTRYSSLAALVAAASAPTYAALAMGTNGTTVVIALMSAGLIAKHRQNIGRLLAGTESKIGSKKKAGK